MDQCPPDEDLIAFALGNVDDARRETFEGHLDACTTCQHVLAEAAHAFATAVTAPLSEDGDFNTTFQPGAVVAGRYVISRFIARGAMGEVYEAYDRDLAGRVALKTVTSTACDNSRAVRRLKAEVQLARRVSHPNVCRIYDFGTHVMRGTGVELHFLTMEFVEGETLGQRVRLGGALPTEEAVEIARELLLALRAAHGAGVLHRDFKSDNVMLKLGPVERSSAVVLDFGLARDVDHEPPASRGQPTVVGTFGYMAPEVLEGTPHSMASDIYALGVVWFEMLTGQLPFEGAASSARSPECVDAPTPAPSRFNPQLSRELDEIVLRCLARAPEERFATASEVLDALEALDALDGRRPSSVRPVATRARQTNAPGRNTRFISLLALAGVSLTGAAYWVGLTTSSPGKSQHGLSQTSATPTSPPASPEPSSAGLESSKESVSARPAARVEEVPTNVTTAAMPAATPTRASPATARAPAPQRKAATPAHAPAASEPSQAPVTAAAATAPAVPPVANPAPTAPNPATSIPPQRSPFIRPRAKKPDWINPFDTGERRTARGG